MHSKKQYRVIGMMSGTSLDGLDLAYCLFEKKKRWTFQILAGKTYSYSKVWKNRLSKAHKLPGEELLELHAVYGRHVGKACLQFINQFDIDHVDFIASHGHTVFHQPKKKFTFQLGDGSAILAATGLPVICDFRTLDVALGGEGAPLVPLGDKLLFSDYDVCLNLGGIANLSMDSHGIRKAFDVCFCNMALNHLMSRIDKPYDKGGIHASMGKVQPDLLRMLHQVFRGYRRRPSLSREMFEKDWQPVLDNPVHRLEDALRTYCEFVSEEITRAIPPSKKSIRLLATGGGALNNFLVKLLGYKLEKRGLVIVPARQIIECKEALVFAFLGVLRSINSKNVLRSVTGASRDSSSGSIVGF